VSVYSGDVGVATSWTKSTIGEWQTWRRYPIGGESGERQNDNPFWISANTNKDDLE